LSPILELLAQGRSEEVVQELAQGLTVPERQTYTQVIEQIVRRHRSQKAASGLEDCFYQVNWELQPRRVGVETALRTPRASWLILAEDRSDGLGGRLAQMLERRGETSRVLRWEQAAGLEEEIRNGGPFKGIVHLWNLEGPTGDFQQSLETGAGRCESVLRVVQALLKLGQSARLWLITRGAVAVAEGGVLAGLAQRPLWGMGKAIALEQPKLWGGLVDLCQESAPEDQAELLLEELLLDSGEDQVAWRATQRWVPRLKPCPAAVQKTIGLKVRADGAYLITGGLGALGLQTAQWLASQGAGHLLLTSRELGCEQVDTLA
jgi:myxalamid-type polyketide synthase MxaE and MxaD